MSDMSFFVNVCLLYAVVVVVAVAAAAAVVVAAIANDCAIVYGVHLTML